MINHFENLPNELLDTVFAYIPPLERLNVALACRKFAGLLKHSERRMLGINVHQFNLTTSEYNNQVAIEGVLETYDRSNTLRKKKITFTDREHFFVNFRKLRFSFFTRTFNIRVFEFSNFLWELQEHMERISFPVERIEFVYESIEPCFEEFERMWNASSKKAHHLELRTLIPFEKLVMNDSCKSVQVTPLKKLNIISHTVENNFDPEVWNIFLNANKLKTLEFFCLEHIEVNALSDFCELIFKRINKQTLRTFILQMDPANYTWEDVVQFKRLMDRLFCCEISKFHAAWLIYIKMQDNEDPYTKKVICVVFNGNFKEIAPANNNNNNTVTTG